MNDADCGCRRILWVRAEGRYSWTMLPADVLSAVRRGEGHVGIVSVCGRGGGADDDGGSIDDAATHLVVTEDGGVHCVVAHGRAHRHCAFPDPPHCDSEQNSAWLLSKEALQKAAADESTDDPAWFTDLFDALYGICLFPSADENVRIAPVGMVIPRPRWEQLPRGGEVERRLFQMSEAWRTTVRVGSARLGVPEILSQQQQQQQQRWQCLEGDTPVSPFFHVCSDVDELEAFEPSWAVRGHTVRTRMCSAVEAAMRRAVVDNCWSLEMESGRLSDACATVSVMDCSHPLRPKHRFVFSLWVVFSALVVPNVRVLDVCVFPMVRAHMPPDLVECLDRSPYARRHMPVPLAGGRALPLEPKQMQPLCRAGPSVQVLLRHCLPLFPTVRMRGRCLFLPLYAPELSATDARTRYWESHDDLQCLGPWYEDPDALALDQTGEAIAGALAKWRMRHKGCVTKLAHCLLLNGRTVDFLGPMVADAQWVAAARDALPGREARVTLNRTLRAWMRTDQLGGAGAMSTGGQEEEQERDATTAAGLLRCPPEPSVYDLMTHVRAVRQRPASGDDQALRVLRTAQRVCADTPYVTHPPDLLSGVRFVKASLGTGKTTANMALVVRWLKVFRVHHGTRRQLRVLVATPRRTLAMAVTTTFNDRLEREFDEWDRTYHRRHGLAYAGPLRFVHYRDEGARSSDNNLAVWQLESFRWLTEAQPFDVVLLDEVASLMCCLTGRMVRKNKGQMEETVAQFQRILTHSRLVVVSDGNLTLRDVRAILAAAGAANRPATMQIYERVVDRGDVRWYLTETPDREDTAAETCRARGTTPAEVRAACKGLSKWMTAILHAVRDGQRVYVYSSSRKLIEDKLLPMLRSRAFLAEADLLVMTAHTVDHGAPMDVNVAWSTKRVVVVSPTVTVGLDFNPQEPYFHAVFAYVSHEGAIARDCVQGIVRVRMTRHRLLHLCLRCREDSVPSGSNRRRVFRVHCMERARATPVLVRRLTAMHPQHHAWTAAPPWLEELAIDNSMEAEINHTDLFNVLRALLQQAGYNCTTQRRHDLVARHDPHDTDVYVYYDDGGKRAYDEIHDLDDEEARAISVSETRTDEEWMALLKHEFDSTIMRPEVDRERRAAVWDFIVARRRNTMIKRLRVDPVSPASGVVSSIINYDARHNNLVHFVRDHHVHLRVVGDILHNILGLDSGLYDRTFSRREAESWVDRIEAMARALPPGMAQRQRQQLQPQQQQPAGNGNSNSNRLRRAVEVTDSILRTWSGASLYAYVSPPGNAEPKMVRTDGDWKNYGDDPNMRFQFALVPAVNNAALLVA